MIDKEAIRKYIEQRTQIIDEFKAKLKREDDVFCQTLIESCPIKKGTVIKRTSQIGTYRPTTKVSYYKVVDYEATPNGTITLVCNKRKINGEYGSKISKLLSVNYYNDFAIPTGTIDEYEIVNDSM